MNIITLKFISKRRSRIRSHRKPRRWRQIYNIPHESSVFQKSKIKVKAKEDSIYK
uniref:Uncharacterized protein n=1 Tax=Tetranychus urticae TaxID=32264 RepID=T1KIN9_TETUR